MNKADREAFIAQRTAVATAPVVEPPFTESDLLEYRRAAEHIIKAHPELTDGTAINEILAEGFDKNGAIHQKLIARAVKDRRPDFQAHIFSERGRADLHALNNVRDDEERSFREYERIVGLLERNGAYREYAPKVSEEDSYIQQRREAIREGRRRG